MLAVSHGNRVKTGQILVWQLIRAEYLHEQEEHAELERFVVVSQVQERGRGPRCEVVCSRSLSPVSEHTLGNGPSSSSPVKAPNLSMKSHHP